MAAVKRLKQVQTLLTPSAETETRLLLPDSTNVSIVTSQRGYDVYVSGGNVLLFQVLERTGSPALPGTVATSNNIPIPVLQLVLQAQSLEVKSIWAAIYALFTVKPIPRIIISVPLTTPELTSIRDFIVQTGMGVTRPDLSPEDIALSQCAFWQGAGAPQVGGWLNPTGKAFMSNAPFPFIPSFTRLDQVITSHPLRAPKPKGGDVLYTRWVASMKKAITFKMVNPMDDGDVDIYRKLYQQGVGNSDWKETLSLAKDERQYLLVKSKDPHVLPLIGYWDNVPFGYFEIFWVRVSSFYAFNSRYVHSI